MANRVDSKMVELGLAQSRERARALIIEGVVLLDGVRVMKPSDTIRDGQILSLKENPIPFVSRGGLKLQKAIDTYQISLKDRVCVDIGASTGGFTDCMLMHGAKKV
ncbi:MAG TPA: TlyA family rRNA (cytidine-2'-O)-methyltransferase, partial [Clostridiales bacterium]|nr:TlyA family rRNA (cytidine-2'-O)-methyltransferase [Clostridiales bacterium]